MTSTQFHQHTFANVEDYLHHRPPYLLVSSIEKIEDESIQTTSVITGDEYFAQGHFPGAPIVPGAMMQEMTTQSAGILIAARYNPMAEYNTHDPFFNEYALGVLRRVRSSKFRSFARPGDTLNTFVTLVDQLGDVFEFEGRIEVSGKRIMSNRFQLANILSQTLIGENSPAG